MKYSNELMENVERISNYYENHDTFDFLQKIIFFMIECIIYHVPEQYFIISTTYISNYIKNSLKIWERDGSESELTKVGLEYNKKIRKIKTFKEMNRKEYGAWGCIQSILYNGYNDPTNQFVYDFIELFIKHLETLEIDEKYIKLLLEKYFKKIII
jgi:hypothetical protein